MKKLSISVLSLLAIVFAVSSAFTSAKKVNAISYEIFNVDPDVVAVASGLSEAQYEGANAANLDQNLATVFSNTIAQGETIDQWIVSIDPDLTVNDFCQTLDSDQVCLVKFEKDGTDVTDVLEFKAGDRITQ